MRWEIGQIGGKRLLRSLARILIAGAIMYAVAWGGVALLGSGTGLLDRALILTGVGGASLAVYLAVSYLLGAEELTSVVALIRKQV
jgi:hypothetical protein